MTPDLSAAIERHALLDAAETLGIDVEPERCDWDAVEHAVDAVLALPADLRGALVAEINDGQEP